MEQVLVEVVVAATKSNRLHRHVTASVLLLSLLQPLYAETVPERASLSYKYLDYKDYQPDQDRISVKAHSFGIVVPIADEWSISATKIKDTVSGASPRYHTQSLVKMYDVRDAVDVSVTKYFSDATLKLGKSESRESDYISNSYSLSGTIALDSKNTVLNWGLSHTSDEINPNNRIVVDQKKRINDYMVGVTQVLTPIDIVQYSVRYSKGEGYYSDPYKFGDSRPSSRYINSHLLRWNHFFLSTEGTSRLSYRNYKDSFGINSHTLNLEYAQPLKGGWVITPLVRYYSQSAAYFYLPTDPRRYPRTTIPPEGVNFYSMDQRLSSFGARTLGIKVAKAINKDLTADVKYEDYQQRGRWSLFGGQDNFLAPFSAKSIQVGLTYFF